MPSITNSFNNFLANRIALFQLAWLITLLCVFIPALLARAQLRDKVSLYNAMALFACVWMLVLPTYAAPGDTRTEAERQLIGLTSDLAAVLLVYVGGLLVAAARTNQANPAVKVVPWELRAPLALLLIVAIPNAITIPGSLGAALKGVFGFGGQFTDKQVSLAVGEFLVVIAFVSVARGIHALCGRSKLFVMLVVILSLYAVASVMRALSIWEEYSPAGPIQVLSVTAAKLAMTTLVSIAVLQYARQLTHVSPDKAMG